MQVVWFNHGLNHKADVMFSMNRVIEQRRFVPNLGHDLKSVGLEKPCRPRTEMGKFEGNSRNAFSFGSLPPSSSCCFEGSRL